MKELKELAAKGVPVRERLAIQSGLSADPAYHVALDQARERPRRSRFGSNGARLLVLRIEDKVSAPWFTRVPADLCFIANVFAAKAG